MGRPTMRQLRSWHRRLTTAHAKAVAVSREAQAILPDDGSELTIIMDPIVELHAALCCIEGFIEEREGR
jgi:hypothetical protein